VKISKKNTEYLLNNNLELLTLMSHDQENQNSLYRPGKYWMNMSNNTLKEMKSKGIGNFRGSDNSIGQSCSDNKTVDSRDGYNVGVRRRFARWLTTLFPLNKIYDSQLRLTETYLNQANIYAQEMIKCNSTVDSLLKKYKMPYSLLGGCISKAEIGKMEYSLHYLNLLEQHDNLAKCIEFENISSVFEIGGGFGANVHILLENYPNIKKILYLDISPHLYIGTQYLKAFYGESVKDYGTLKNLKTISFSEDESLEIICIPPWMIEKFDDSIDLFLNAHSFVEMPEDIVKNYVAKIDSFNKSSDTIVALTSYDGHDEKTINPNNLKSYFKDRKFELLVKNTLLDSSRDNFYYISSGRSK